MIPSTPPKVLLFDLGGVIVRWTGIEALSELTGLTRAKVISKLENLPEFKAYEVGACSDAEFTDAMIQAFELRMSAQSFREQWCEWVGRTYTGTKTVLMDLGCDYTIACLSNTNAMHWARLRDHINIDNYFDHAFASHLIEAAKPEADSFEIPIEIMDVAPEDIWFFDDTFINVAAAKSFGMKAFMVNREVGVIPTLRELGLVEETPLELTKVVGDGETPSPDGTEPNSV